MENNKAAEKLIKVLKNYLDNKKYYEEKLDDVILRFKNEYKELQSKYSKEVAKVNKLEMELFNLKHEKGALEVRNNGLMEEYIFSNENFFYDYIFGDNRLPYIRLLYNYLYENKLYIYTFGSFCYALQKETTAKFRLNVPSTKFNNADIGLILYKLGEYCEFTYTETIEWLTPILEVTTIRNNILTTTEFIEYIGSSDTSKVRKPKNRDKINKVFNKMSKEVPFGNPES